MSALGRDTESRPCSSCGKNLLGLKIEKVFVCRDCREQAVRDVASSLEPKDMVPVYCLLEALTSASKDGLSLGQMAECLIQYAAMTDPDVVVRIGFAWPRKKKTTPKVATGPESMVPANKKASKK